MPTASFGQVDRAGEELDAEGPEPLGFGVDIVDEEEDLAGRPALGGFTVDQVEGACSRSPNLVPPVTNSAYPASRSLKGSPKASR